MPARASWKGFLNLSLVSVPVKAYTSSNSGGTIRLNQLHSECNSRIQQKVVCPNCGDISRDQIVKGYEYAKNQFVVIDLDELEKLRSQDESRAVRIESFISPEQIDPIYFSDTHYFLVPDGAVGHKPYSLILAAMQRKGLVCVARVVLHNKEQLVLVRPVDDLLCMTVLKYSSQVKAPTSFADEITASAISEDEYALAETLIDESTAADFDLSAFKDQYTERLTQIIEAKVSGEEVVTASTSDDAPQVVNLMEALKASVAKAQAAQGKPASPVTAKKPTKKAAPSAGSKKTTKKPKELLAEQLANPKPKKKTTTRKKKSG